MLEISGIIFAFSAGIFSLLSPCSYTLIPGYISYYLGSEFSITKGLTGGMACTMGLLTVFLVIGGSASLLGELIPLVIPYLSLASGGVLIIMGAGMIAQNRFHFVKFSIMPSKRKGFLGLYLFGLIYGFAGVGCSAPVFLSVLFYAVSQGFINGVFSFTLYALGMGLPLIFTSIFLAEGKEYVISKILRSSTRIQKISGVVLVIIGFYQLYYYKITYL
jgi:cytochrome c-type biogenesis protein